MAGELVRSLKIQTVGIALNMEDVVGAVLMGDGRELKVVSTPLRELLRCR